jgi:hypothetical protein
MVPIQATDPESSATWAYSIEWYRNEFTWSKLGSGERNWILLEYAFPGTVCYSETSKAYSLLHSIRTQNWNPKSIKVQLA